MSAKDRFKEAVRLWNRSKHITKPQAVSASRFSRQLARLAGGSYVDTNQLTRESAQASVIQ
jgi:hypothetical protein